MLCTLIVEPNTANYNFGELLSYNQLIPVSLSLPNSFCNFLLNVVTVFKSKNRKIFLKPQKCDIHDYITYVNSELVEFCTFSISSNIVSLDVNNNFSLILPPSLAKCFGFENNIFDSGKHTAEKEFSYQVNHIITTCSIVKNSMSSCGVNNVIFSNSVYNSEIASSTISALDICVNTFNTISFKFLNEDGSEILFLNGCAKIVFELLKG